MSSGGGRVVVWVLGTQRPEVGWDGGWDTEAAL